jgi:uncharacterized OsmC-like protein
MAEMGALADPAATGEMAENAPSVARDGDAGGVRSGEPGRMAMIDRFDRVITIDGDDLTDDDRAKLLMIADKCPVHRTLEASSVIATVLSR